MQDLKERVEEYRGYILAAFDPPSTEGIFDVTVVSDHGHLLEKLSDGRDYINCRGCCNLDEAFARARAKIDRLLDE